MASDAFMKLTSIVSFTTSNIPWYIAVVVMVPPPEPSVIKMTSPFSARFLAVGGYSDIPTAPTALTSLSPKTMSPPTRRVLPATSGTFTSSETAQTPAVKSKSFPTSPSSAR